MPSANELLQEGRYRIDQPANGSETVFEAYDTVRNTNVIVREIPVKLNKVATVSQRESLKLAFATQAKALTEIEHDALLHVHDFFSEIDRQFLVMEYFEGVNLRELLLQSRKAFAVAKVVEWADQLLDALSYLHTRKPAIIHRNIRPENLNLDSSGKVKLLGVGFENASDADEEQDNQADGGLRYSPLELIWPGLDPASQKVITNSYDDRSERILKGPADARSDIYSLGATLYFLITGNEPVDPLERSIDVLEGKLDPLREPTAVNSQIPPEISDVLMKALEIKRENRYDSAVIMRQVLQTALEGVGERESEEGLERNEAAESIQVKADPVVPTQEFEAELQRQQEWLAKERREADEKRQAEEARAHEIEEAEKAAAADVERQRHEKEEAERLAADADRQRREKEEAERLAAAERQRHEKEEAERLAVAERQRHEKEEAERKAAADRQKREAAEADRQKREKEEAERVAAEAESKKAKSSANVPVPAAEVVAYRQKEEVDEDELALVLKELEEAEGKTGEKPLVEEVPDDVQVIEGTVDMAPESETDQTFETDEEVNDLFSTPEKSGRSLPMPAIAGAIGLVLVIGVGGWFVMSGSSEPAKTEQIQVAPVTEPAPAESAPVDTITSTSQPETAASGVETATTDPAAAKAAATPKPKKTDPKADKKKAVTVDDLINDN